MLFDYFFFVDVWRLVLDIVWLVKFDKFLEDVLVWRIFGVDKVLENCFGWFLGWYVNNICWEVLFWGLNCIGYWMIFGGCNWIVEVLKLNFLYLLIEIFELEMLILFLRLIKFLIFKKLLLFE